MTNITIKFQDVIKKQYQKAVKDLETASSKSWHDERKREKLYNSSCPHCGHDKLITLYRDINGKIKGSMSGHSSLFYGSMSGYVDGKIQTDEVLACGKCHSEIKPYEREYETPSRELGHRLHGIYFYFNEINKKVEFNKNDPSEEYSTYKEKYNAHILNAAEIYKNCKTYSWIKQFYPDTIRWLVKNHYFDFKYYNEIAKYTDEQFYLYGCMRKPKELEPKRKWYSFLFE